MAAAGNQLGLLMCQLFGTLAAVAADSWSCLACPLQLS